MEKAHFIIPAVVAVIAVILVAVLTAAHILPDFVSDSADKPSSRSSAAFRVDYIDVGKGDCILIRSAEHTVMIDTGYKDTADDVSDFLDAAHITQIDALILTHYDKDHIGGAKKILSRYPVGKIYIPDYSKDTGKYKKLLKAIDKNDIAVESVSEDLSFTADDAVFTVMPSGVSYRRKTENDNDMSLLVSVVYKNDSYLFTGDIEKEGIRSFLQVKRRSYDVIKMPHHGRSESNSKALLDTVKPRYAIITDDKDNSAEVSLCLLLKSQGILYYTTAENGTISVTGNGSGNYQIQTEKNG